MIYKKLNHCNCCKKKNHLNLLSIKNQPVLTANNSNKLKSLYKNKFINLNLFICKNCLNIQLKEAINPKILYDGFNYETSITLGLVNHFKLLANNLIKKFKLSKNDNVLDIGSNDGSFLKNFVIKKIKVLGIDPAKKIAQKATKNGINTLPIFFNYNSSKKIKKKYGKFKVITSFNTFANIFNFDEFILGIKNLLTDDGVFIVETQYGVDVLKKKLIDTVYHEHINYFTIKSLQELFKRFGLIVDDYKFLPNKGGSIRIYVKKDIKIKKKMKLEKIIKKEMNYLNLKKIGKFSHQLNEIKFQLQKLINKIKNSKNEKIYAFGSSVGSTTLINFFNLNDYIEYIYDDKPLTNLLNFKHKSIKIKNSESMLRESNIIILAWRYTNNIIKKHSGKKLKFITFLPKIKIINK